MNYKQILEKGCRCFRCAKMGLLKNNKHPIYKSDGKLYKCEHCGHYISVNTIHLYNMSDKLIDIENMDNKQSFLENFIIDEEQIIITH